MSEKYNRRARAAQVMRAIRQRRAAQKECVRTASVKEALFEKVKEKMVMRIFGVSCKRAKAIIAGRMADKVGLETVNDVKQENGIRDSRRSDCDDESDDERMPVGEIVVGGEE